LLKMSPSPFISFKNKVIQAIEMTHEQRQQGIYHALTVAHNKRTVIEITYTLHYIITYYKAQ